MHILHQAAAFKICAISNQVMGLKLNLIVWSVELNKRSFITAVITPMYRIHIALFFTPSVSYMRTNSFKNSDTMFVSICSTKILTRVPFRMC